MKDTVTVTFTSEQYNWVKAIANDTFKDACEWLDNSEDDDSEAHSRRVKYNESIRDMAQQVLRVEPKS